MRLVVFLLGAMAIIELAKLLALALCLGAALVVMYHVTGMYLNRSEPEELE